MRHSSRLSAILHYLAYFGILLLIGLFVRDLNGQPPLSSTIHSFQPIIKMGDPKYFAAGALDVFRNGWFTSDYRWLINLWPPGFMLLEAGILWVFGENAPFIAVLLVLSALLQACWLTIFRQLLRPQVPAVAASLLPLLPFAFPVSRQFLLQPTGLVLGEAFALGCFLTAVLLLVRSVRTERVGGAIAAGCLFGLAAYFRSQYGTLVTFFTLGALPLGLWLGWRIRRLPADSGRRVGAKASLKTILLALVAAHAIMVPWRAYAMLELDRTTWVATQELVAQNALTPSEELYRKGGRWIVRGGGNLACLLVPEYCGQDEPSLYYRAFLEHPFEWMSRKASLLDDYWFAPLREWMEPKSRPSRGDWVANTLLLLFLVALLPLSWRVRRERDALVQFWILASFFGCFAALFTMVHLETRYFYPIKIFAVVATTLLAASAWSRRRSPTDAGTLPVQGERITTIGQSA